MSIRANGKRVAAIFRNDSSYSTSYIRPENKVHAVHANRVQVWPDKDVLWLNADDYGHVCRERLDAELARRGLNPTTVRKMPFDIGFYRSKPADEISFGAADLFGGMTKLAEAPHIRGAEHIMRANMMFRNCESLVEFTQPLPNLREANSMFSGCSSLKRVVVGSVTPGKALLTDITRCLTGAPNLESVLISVSPDLSETDVLFYNRGGSSNPKNYPNGSGTGTTPIKYKTSGGKTIDIRGVVIRVAGASTLNNKNLARISDNNNSGLTFEPYYRETSTGFVRIPY